MPSEKYERARETLPEELRTIFDQFVADYKFAATVHHGSPYVSYIVLAEMVKIGWRHIDVSVKNAIEILYNRYIKDDPERKASIEIERVNAEIARVVYDLRTEMGLTQEQFAEKVGTTQSIIDSLENADCDDALSLLQQITNRG